jgi:GDP-L-fucose synthase
VLLNLVEVTNNTWINIGSGEEYSIRQFAAFICEITGYCFDQIEWDLSRYVGAKSKVLEITKLKSFFPSFTPRPLKEGLIEVVDWLYSKETSTGRASTVRLKSI